MLQGDTGGRRPEADTWREPIFLFGQGTVNERRMLPLSRFEIKIPFFRDSVGQPDAIARVNSRRRELRSGALCVDIADMLPPQ